MTTHTSMLWRTLYSETVVASSRSWSSTRDVTSSLLVRSTRTLKWNFYSESTQDLLTNSSKVFYTSFWFAYLHMFNHLLKTRLVAHINVNLIPKLIRVLIKLFISWQDFFPSSSRNQLEGTSETLLEKSKWILIERALM